MTPEELDDLKTTQRNLERALDILDVARQTMGGLRMGPDGAQKLHDALTRANTRVLQLITDELESN